MNFKMTDDFRKFLAGVPDYRKETPAPEDYRGSDCLMVHLPPAKMRAVRLAAAATGEQVGQWVKRALLEACTK